MRFKDRIKCPDLKNHPATKIAERMNKDDWTYLQEYDSNYEGNE
jgi:hypothetical protein